VDKPKKKKKRARHSKKRNAEAETEKKEKYKTASEGAMMKLRKKMAISAILVVCDVCDGRK
jgi:hypothetical protein